MAVYNNGHHAGMLNTVMFVSPAGIQQYQAYSSKKLLLGLAGIWCWIFYKQVLFFSAISRLLAQIQN
jgi:hypothetical protein